MLKRVFLFITFLCSVSVFSENNVLITSEWQSVMGGDVVAPPKRTSYGFIMLSEGRILNASTENGTIIWRRNIKGLPSKYFSVTDENFVYITTDNAKNLSLYNPDGTFLWEVVLEKAAIADPLAGRDGRVFVMEEDAISCYGAHGQRKWRTEVPKSSGLPLVEMNDGSLLYILDFTKNNASVALRISPYGEKLEDVQFVDNITTFEEYQDGVILGFKNGLVGSCAVIDNVTETTGSVSHSVNGGTPTDIVIGYDGFSVLFSNNTIAEYALNNLDYLWSQKLSNEFPNETYATYIDGMYVFASTNYVAAYHSTHSNIGGLLAWERIIKPLDSSFFPVVTNSAYLVLAHPNWVISGYNLLGEETEFQGVESEINTTERSYKGFHSSSVNQRYSYDDMFQRLTEGDYGLMEALYKRDIDNKIYDYTQEYFNFERNTNISEKAHIFTIASLFESSTYNDVVPLILTNETDIYFTQLAFQIAANIAYDPNELMLKSIEQYYSNNKARLNENVIYLLCDAVYEICRYMGKPALTKRGKQILSDILQNNFDASIQKKVSETLYLFIELEQ